MQFGTARKPAALKRLSPQPANLDGTLSHQVASPGPPLTTSMSLRRNDSSTAFLSHWLTRHAPSVFSATRACPPSRRRKASSTASRTAPRVAGVTAARSSQAASRVAARSAVIGGSMSEERAGVISNAARLCHLCPASPPSHPGWRLSACTGANLADIVMRPNQSARSRCVLIGRSKTRGRDRSKGLGMMYHARAGANRCNTFFRARNRRWR